MKHNNRKFYSGLTLIELVVAMSISLMLVLVVGALIVSQTQAWQQTYNKAHSQIQEDSLMLATAFGKMGRMANRNNYVIYGIAGTTFTPVVSATPNVDTVVSGDAVEFRYWDVPLDSTDSHQLMDVTKTATAYALFYLSNGQIKVDYGPYNWATNVGAIPTGGGTRNTAGINTLVLANNVTADPNIKIFSHTTVSGQGYGCVRMNANLTDPSSGDKIKVMTSVLMRNMWPR
jgi:Tfp pilus assembly protein PilE